MVKVLEYSFKVSVFWFQLHYYVHFWTDPIGKDMNIVIFSAVG